jgi:hypothetical protein
MIQFLFDLHKKKTAETGKKLLEEKVKITRQSSAHISKINALVKYVSKLFHLFAKVA